MDCRGVGGQPIDHSDLDHVTPVSDDSLTGRLAVDSERGLKGAVIVNVFFGDRQSVLLGLPGEEGAVGVIIDRLAVAPVTSVFWAVASRRFEADSRSCRRIETSRGGGRSKGGSRCAVAIVYRRGSRGHAARACGGGPVASARSSTSRAGE